MNNTRVEFLLLKYLNVSLSLCGLKGAIKATIPERRESKAKRLLQGLGNFPDSRGSLPGVIKTLSWQIRRSLLEYGQDFEVVVKICVPLSYSVCSVCGWFGVFIGMFLRSLCVVFAYSVLCIEPVRLTGQCFGTERAVGPEKSKARNRRSLKSPDKGFDDHLFFFLAYYSQIIEGKYRKQISQIGVLVFLSSKTNCFLCLSSFSHTSQVLLPVDSSVWCEMLCLSWHPAFNTW